MIKECNNLGASVYKPDPGGHLAPALFATLVRARCSGGVDTETEAVSQPAADPGSAPHTAPGIVGKH